MIRLRKKISLILLLLLGFLKVFSQDADLFGEEQVASYARFLFSTNQYQYAAEEYERLVFMNRAEEAYQVELLKSYRFSGEYEKGIRAFTSLHDPSQGAGSDLLKEYSKISLLSGNIDNIKLMLSEYPMDPQFKNNLDLTMRLISYPEYSLNLDGLDESQLDNDLLNLYSESFNLRYKNRFLAASLSTVVPGLGKVYAGRWKDALMSLVFIGGTGFQAYRAFKKDGVNSVYGWIMGSISLGFYVGNIYGSAKAARQYNMNQNLNYREKLVHHYIDHY